MCIRDRVLIVQNSFPVAMVGTATATNNFFRQLGSSIGASLVGSLFIHNMRTHMEERMPEAMAQLPPEQAQAIGQQFSGGSSNLTPHQVAQLPDAIREVVLTSYNDGLTPVFLMIVPLAVIAFLLLIPITEDPLKETVD